MTRPKRCANPSTAWRLHPWGLDLQELHDQTENVCKVLGFLGACTRGGWTCRSCMTRRRMCVRF